MVVVVVMDGRSSSSDFVTEDSGDGRDGRDVVFVADAIRQEAVADLPREDARVFALQLFYVTHHLAIPLIRLRIEKSFENRLK